jgi:excisionase family DNA binding protein
MSENEYFLTAPEFAEVANLNVKTVYRLCQQGKIRSVRIGNALRIPSSVVEELQRGAEVGDGE